MGTDERIYTAADAQVDLMLNGLPEVSTLTPAQDIELRRMNPNGDGFIAPRQARAEARVSAELRSSNARLWKIMFGILGLFSVSWLGNAGLTAAVVILSKDLKVEGGTLKNNKDGGAVSTVSQKKVYEVTLLTPRRQLDEQGSGATHESSTVVAQVTCASVLEAISSIEKGNDGSLVKMSVGDGKFWTPRMSAASYNFHENSFGMEQIYLDDQRDVSYEVTCEISKAVCESTLDSLCDAVTNSEVISFGDAFDGDINIPSSRRRRLGNSKNDEAHDECDCNYHAGEPAGGCSISKAAPKGKACECVYKGAWTCGGDVVSCGNPESPKCTAPDKSVASCKMGGGDCGGYRICDCGGYICDCDYDCDCEHHAGGCTISKVAPKYTACKCKYMGYWTCKGEVVPCRNEGSELCPNPDFSAEACQLGGGDCDGY